MSTDHAFDVLAVLIFVVVPLALASFGLALAVQGSSIIRRALGYAVSVSGTWVGVLASISVARCPSQDGELCGEQSDVHGDEAAVLLALLVLLYGLLVVWWRAKARARADRSPGDLN